VDDGKEKLVDSVKMKMRVVTENPLYSSLAGYSA
jgi:hypothetical protein